MSNGITQKQEAFCLAFMETGNQSEAYRRAYNAENMKPETIAKRACELMDDGNVAGRIAELRAEAVRRSAIVVDDLIAELEEGRQAALTAETVQASAAISATMAKAKLLGLDKQLVEQVINQTTVHSGTITVSGLADKLGAIKGKR